MENSGEAAEDDQGSGWLQVKKRHRSTSRFSLQGWVGGLKQASGVSRSQVASIGKGGNSNAKFSGNPSRERGDFPAERQESIVNIPSVSKEVKGVHYLDQNVVCQDGHYTGTLVQTQPTTCDKKAAAVEVILENDYKPDPCQKIKWGDLDDEELTQHIKNTVVTEIRFGDIGSCDVVSRKADQDSSVVSCNSPIVDAKENNVITSVHTDCHLLRSSSFAFEIEDNCKVSEVISEDAKVRISGEEVSDSGCNISNVSDSGFNISNVSNSGCNISNVSDSGCNISNVSDAGCNISNVSNSSDVTFLSESAIFEQDALIMEVPVPTTIIKVANSDISDIPVTLSGPEKSGDFVEAAFFDSQQTDKFLGDLSNSQVRSGNDAGDLDESKERFRQRLWCFLFENLNRAVDELYLLCELECDMGQMKEAMLVLHEAASDFKDLKSRVEEFENVKRSTSQVIEVPPVTMKSDHRRPHALSWEVRRMTTSTHKAEILSSSLEAFKKIQQERAKMHTAGNAEQLEVGSFSCHRINSDDPAKLHERSYATLDPKETAQEVRKKRAVVDNSRENFVCDRRNSDLGRSCKMNLTQKGQAQTPLSAKSAVSVSNKSRREQMGSASLSENVIDKLPKSIDHLKKQCDISEKDRDKKNGPLWKSMDAWKEKRNWEDILASPCRGSSRFTHSPGMIRKSAERARNLHVKLMSPEKKKKTSLDLKKEAEEKHARAMRIRNELENERIQKLQRSSQKFTRVNEWQAVRSMKLREGMYERHQRSESRHEAHLAQVVKRAGDESIKVNEVRFITSLNDENKKLILRQKLHDSELRRAEKLQVMKTKQKEDMAREEAVLERKKIIEAEKMQRLAEIQRRKDEALVRRDEERKASSAAREARTIEQLRRKKIRAKAQQEEAELLAQKLAERLKESEQRRKFYLEQIRERASMDFRDQSSPLLRRSLNKDAQGRSTPTSSGEEYETNTTTGVGGSSLQTGNDALQQSLKRRIKRIRQRLMALKHEFPEAIANVENGGVGYRTAVGTARSKIGRWIQELQKFRQARKEGAVGIGLITAEMIKFLDGKEPELQASRQAGLLDFIASALPASHTSKPEAYQVTIYLLRLLKVVLSLPMNRSYFIAQNLLPPIIPLLAATLENYIKIAASSNSSGSSNVVASKTSVGNLESVSEALDGFLWTVATILGHVSSDESQPKMQDGLLELVLAYQVIHRLRDLFALYDRPQVEGSPFPSSIHLSINLLAVLTSRSKEISSITCESYVIEEEPELALLNNDLDVVSPNVAEGGPLDESCIIKTVKESVSSEKDSDGIKIVSTGTADLNIADDSQNVLVNDSVKSSDPQKDEKCPVDNSAEQKNVTKSGLNPSVKFLLSAISETGLVCLPSLLTAVLLQANNRLYSEQAPHVLPSNFEEVATGVLKVLNNLALIDIKFMQKMLARPDLKMEFFHLMSFLLSHCTSKWRVATDQVGLLLLESLLLLSYFSLFHRKNQAVLRWGKSPTILHKVCDLPFVFFSDPELMPVMAGTLVAACYGCEQNKGVVQQELSTDMLLSLLMKSCRNSRPTIQSSSSPDNFSAGCTNDNNQAGPDSRKNQTDVILKSTRQNLRSTRISSSKSGALGNGNGIRPSKIRNQRDNKTLKLNEEMSNKQNQSAPETPSTLMLHSRFSDGFIDRAKQFFAAETSALCE